MSDLIGKKISHYRIVEQIGQGGMGVVYKARDTKLDRFVALKFLPPQLGQEGQEKQRFIREAKAASALDHPNICTIYEINETEDGQMYIAMAYYDGEPLKKKIERGPLPVAEAIDIAGQIALGLSRVHEEGIIHRDIKPANILITKRGEIKIVDFGLARLAGRTQMTKTGSTMGTVAYMSPEQIRGEDMDRRTDLWSLGVVIYEMLTGRLPFEGDYDQAVAYSILNQNPEPVAVLRPDAPVAIKQAVEKLLRKDAGERYQQAGGILTDLRSVRRELEADKPKTAPTPTRLPRHRRVLLYSGIALLLLLLAAVGRDLFTGGHEPIDSIAVLPLKNYSGDSEQEYFSDGMTEELIDKLGRIEALRVISNTSVMRYKETNKSLPEIARELDVAAIVEGSVQPFGEQVRIRVRLIDARADQQLWNGSFERELRDVLALQQEVALAIAREVAVTLTPQDGARLQQAQQVDPEAYDLYIRGLQARAKMHWDSQQVIAYFEQAIAIDSSFAPTYAVLAIEYVLENVFDFLPGGEVKARQFAQKALALDPLLSEPYVAIGLVRELVDWDWAGAEEAFQRAIELNPGDAFAHHELAQLWMRLGRFEEAIAREKQALFLDPLSARYQSGVGEVYLYNGRYDQAITELKKVLELDPNATGYLGRAYWETGRYEQALRLWEAFGWPELGLAKYSAVTGQRQKALGILEDWKARWAQGDAEPYILMHGAGIYADLGEKDQALDWLERAYEERLGVLVYIKVDPGHYTLRGEPRFQALLEKMGFPE